MIYIGYDIGTSYITAAAVDTQTGKRIAVATSPDTPMEITSVDTDFFEQEPDLWWKHLRQATHKLFTQYSLRSDDVKGIGISYQLHGLVCIDAEGNPVRKAIIQDDRRSQLIGNEAYVSLGAKYCKDQLLNAPSHFAASRLKWIQQNEPKVFSKIHKVMVPGDYIAYKLSGTINTTVSGLSEGIFWDFKKEIPSLRLIEEYDFNIQLLPDLVPGFGDQGEVTTKASEATEIPAETPLLYRASDASSVALSTNTLEPGDLLISCQDKGLMYAISETKKTKELERCFQIAHVNHQPSKPRIAKLLKIQGVVPALDWLKKITQSPDFLSMSTLASQIAVGSKHLQVFPFGNGPEALFKNKEIGFHILNGDTKIHDAAYLCRATLESIAFSFVYGIELLKKEGLELKNIKTTNDNILSSEVVATTISTLIGLPIEIYDTSAVIGAARACTISLLGQASFQRYSRENDHINTYKPNTNTVPYIATYTNWLERLNVFLDPKLSNKVHKQS